MQTHDELQRAFIHSVLFRPERIHEAIEYVGGRKVFAPKYQTIWDTILKMWYDKEGIDLVTVCSRVPGKEYESLLCDIAASNFDVRVGDYAKLLSEEYLRKSLVDLGGEISYHAKKRDVDAFDALEVAENKLFKLASGFMRKNFASSREAVTSALESIRYTAATGISGVITGYPELDGLLGGLRDSDLIILAGRPSTGKTALGVNILHNAARNGKAGAIFSLEMATKQLMVRLMARETKIDSMNILHGKINDNELGAIENAGIKLGKLPLFFEDSSGISVGEIRAKARRLKLESNISLIVVDYIQLVSSQKRDSREQEVSQVARALKGLAKELQIPVLCLAQLSRAVEQRTDKRPVLSDLRESGAIEQDADVVIFTYSPSNDDEFRDIIVAKHRNGPLGEVRLGFYKQYTEFYSLGTLPSNTTR